MTTAHYTPEVRINHSLTAVLEKRALIWMAHRAPGWVTSDQLTGLGLLAQVAAGVCYAFAARDRRLLLVGILCIAANWLGDSLDGTLARVRNQQRPRYGFYVDHMADLFGSLALMGVLNSSLLQAGMNVTLARIELPGLESMTCPAVAVEVAPELGADKKIAAGPDDEDYQARVAAALAAALVEDRAEAHPL